MLGEYGAAVLAEHRCRTRDFPRRRRELDRQSDRLDAACIAMFDLDQHVARFGLRIVMHLLDVEHRTGRDTDLGKAREPLRHAALAKARSEYVDKRSEV